MPIQLTDLSAPARLQYWPAIPDPRKSARWEDAQEFATLREALTVAVTKDAPPKRVPWILASSGVTLKPEVIKDLWTKLGQAPER